MKNMMIWLTLTLLATGLAACAPATPPPPTPDIPATTAALAQEIVSGTLTAMPTPTLPPSETPTPTETLTPTATATETATPEPTITATIPPFYGEFAPAGLPPGVDKGYVLFNNETKIRPVYLNITGITAQGERPYYYKWTFHESQHRWDLPFGTYDYVIFLGDKKMYSGSFRINNYDKTTFFIRENKLNIAGP